MEIFLKEIEISSEMRKKVEIRGRKEEKFLSKNCRI